MVAMKHFPNIDQQAALARPILFSKWLSKDYVPVDREVLREYTKARLKVGDCLSTVHSDSLLESLSLSLTPLCDWLD